jgi:beta-N-acetylhexosaminidase
MKQSKRGEMNKSVPAPATTDDLQLEGQIGQLFMAGFYETTPAEAIVALIREERLGGVILFSRNIRDGAQVRALTQALQAVAREAGHAAPLLISIDQENGLVRRLGPDAAIFPGNMALGATGSVNLTTAVAEATGRELRAAGVNMNLAPVADVNNNPANPVIGVRSFGADPAEVARLTAAAVRGYRAASVIATLKHFPGHGDTATDSHLALPVVPFDLDRLAAVELPPFQAGIAAGAEAVMLAHVLLPQIEPAATLPASLSPVVARDLLRGRLGFDGVVMTDCLEMQAVASTVGIPRGAVLALRAGVDLVLISHTITEQRAAIAAARQALRDGTLDSALVRQSLARVARLKEGLAWDAPTLTANDKAAHAQLSDEAYARTTTLATNEAIIPLRLAPEQRVLVAGPQGIAVSQAVDVAYDHAALVAAIRQRHPATVGMILPAEAASEDRTALIRAAEDVDIIIVVTINAWRDAAQADQVRALLATGRPVIGIAAGDPADLALFLDLRAGLATYEYTLPALAAAVRVIFGELPARGRLPIAL